jgi:hypothetical protein
VAAFLYFVKLNYQKTAPENFQSRNGNGENRGGNPEFYLRFCERIAFEVRKVSFWRAKG